MKKYLLEEWQDVVWVDLCVMHIYFRIMWPWYRYKKFSSQNKYVWISVWRWPVAYHYYPALATSSRLGASKLNKIQVYVYYILLKFERKRWRKHRLRVLRVG